MKIKTAVERYTPRLIEFDDSFKSLRKMYLTHLKDGIVAGVVLGILAGLFSNWK